MSVDELKRMVRLVGVHGGKWEFLRMHYFAHLSAYKIMAAYRGWKYASRRLRVDLHTIDPDTMLVEYQGGLTALRPTGPDGLYDPNGNICEVTGLSPETPLTPSMEEESKKRKARLMAMRNFKSVVEKDRQATEITLDTIEASVSGVVEKAIAKRQQEVEAGELDIAAIAPKRPNWDLKRDLKKKLDQLKPQNDAAIADLIRKRIQESGEAGDIAGAVAAHTQFSS
ncbi:hypothetical protein LPJ66_008944 [Kickxella alabastrina]|uniref:Uncharacterized protein n=1 Tax=Kickxella alabastrina TaxID=61397 RepID=A0ACC1I8G0_9FUNG|nr:hypothetical protein LPJ66_008944 [Kickxella alabastrina]